MKYSIRQILKDNWKEYIKTHNVTYHQKREVEKTINCGKNSCNSRICSSCGKRYADNWSNWLKDNLLPIKHRHVVLTVPSVLRKKLRNWNNIKLLMNASLSFSEAISTPIKSHS